jgi:hypothetical protein
MINSQDVYFGITRQCAQVELKNINIFSKKIIFADLPEMEKHFYKNDLHYNFVQLLAQELVMT